MKAADILMWNSGLPNAKNGMLYNSYVYQDANIAPTDWRVAISSDWDDLITNQGGSFSAAPKITESGTIYWFTNSGTNTSGMSLYGSGIRTDSGVFQDIRTYMAIHLGGGDVISIYDDRLDVFNSEGIELTGGASIRMIYDGVGTPPNFIQDYEGRKYDVIQIGTQYWLKQNWACAFLNNGTPIPNVTDNTAWSNLTTLGRCAYNNDESNV